MLTTKITEPGRYPLRNGGYAIVHEIRPGTSTFEVKGNYYMPNKKYPKNHPGTYTIWHVSGRHSIFNETGLDII